MIIKTSKLLSILIVFTLIVMFAGCGKDSGENADANDTGTASETASYNSTAGQINGQNTSQNPSQASSQNSSQTSSQNVSQSPLHTGAVVADHFAASAFGSIPQNYIDKAKTDLHIAYGHTSHGSQLITGMETLANADSRYSGLDLHDTAFESYGADDLGSPDRTEWAAATRKYLRDNPETNVVIWSWCYQVDGTKAEIQTYLNLMNKLESDYPGVKFVYMTGHLDGSGAEGNVNLRNQQIRDYCNANKQILYDFADIESYDPDGKTNYMLLYADDGCNYTEGNWAVNWIDANPRSPLTALANSCSECAHTQCLNGILKAQAAWWLWARLAGWGG